MIQPQQSVSSRLVRGFGYFITAVMLVLALLPLLKLLISAFGGQGNPLSTFATLIHSNGFITITRNTFIMSAGGMLLSIAFGVPLAILATSIPRRFVGAFHIANLLVLIIPSYMTSLAWEMTFGPSGPVNRVLAPFVARPEPLHFFSMGGLIICLGVIHYPFVYLLVYASISSLNGELLRAARASGAPMAAVAVKVIFPMVRASIVGGGLLAFITNVDDFGIPAFIGIPAHITVFSTKIYQDVIGFTTGSFQSGARWSVFAGTISLFALLFEHALERRAMRFVPGPPAIARGWSRTRVIALAIYGLFFVGAAIIPIFMLVITALSPAIGVPVTWHTVTLGNFETVLKMQNTRADLVHSLIFATVAGLVTTVVGALVIGLFRERHRRAGRVIDMLMTLPYALPGMIFGLAMILVFLRPVPVVRVSIYGSIWLIMLAYCLRFLALAMRTLRPELDSMDSGLYKSAIASGASPFSAVSRIILPLFATTFLSSFLFVFLNALTEMTVSSVLASPGTETIGMAILDFEQSGDLMDCAVTSVLTLIVMAVFASIVSWLLKRMRTMRGETAS